ncbi:MAG: sterol desaturase family protein [Candidatus Kapabacteria bacterium]|nr:sterol desaturase family protein [Candidatus Kapabacteria bacterium]MDW8225534.1 sterol desaturase family protein [Bacteroidota bacterium]
MSNQIISNRDETVPLFANPWLDRLTHVHPITPLVLYLPVVGYFSYRGLETLPWYVFVGCFLGGMLLWTFAEYWIHRAIFHYEPKSAWGQRLHFLVHGIHHAYPRDSTRLVMPPVVSIPLAVFFYWFFQWLFGVYQPAIFAGFVLGYVIYDSIHYATHHLPMRGRIGRFLKAHHMRHHYVDEDRSFGISTPLWDLVFGTYQPQTTLARHQVAKSRVAQE